MLEGLTPPKQIHPCKVRDILQSLDASDQEILKKILVDPAWSDKALENALNERGVKISDTPIRKHRKGRCSCA
jgi:hypothetical protein